MTLKKGFIINGEIVCAQCAKNRNFDEESGLKEYDIILFSDEIKSYCEVCAVDFDTDSKKEVENGTKPILEQRGTPLVVYD